MPGRPTETLDTVEKRIAVMPDDALRVDVAAALESLPAHYLEVILLRDFEELTNAETADRLAEPVGPIKSRLHRARSLVREYLSHRRQYRSFRRAERSAGLSSHR